MKLKVLCDCDDNKICMGNFDGEPIWQYKNGSLINQTRQFNNLEIGHKFIGDIGGRVIPKSEWTDWMKEEAYKQNSD